MRMIKQYLNDTVKVCINNVLTIMTASAYKRLADINGLANLKQREIALLNNEKEQVQSALESNEVKASDSLKHNRMPLVNKINAIDHDIDEIEALLLKLEEEKQNVQCEILLLSNVL